MFIHTYDEYWNQGHHVAAFRAGYDKHPITEIRQWCYTAYGEPGTRWIDNIKFGEVLFTDKKDLTLFLLRWA